MPFYSFISFKVNLGPISYKSALSPLKINKNKIRTCIIKNISMPSKENEISLIMESTNSPSYKIWISREKRCELSCNPSAYNRIEVVYNYFGIMISGIGMMFDLLVKHIRCDFKNAGRSIRQIHQNQFLNLLTTFSPHHYT